MDLSLIVCTRDRCDQLRKSLTYLSRLEYSKEWEMVFVDNGSTDGTIEVLKNYSLRAPCPVHIHREERAGLGRARNLAVSVARGQILVFTDDDCYPIPSLLQAVHDVFEDPRIGFAGGPVLLFDPTDAPITTRQDAEHVEIPPRSFVSSGLIQGANMAIRREVVEQVGGFDPELGAGGRFRAYEDIDLLARALAAGWWAAYSPELVVYHHHGRKPGREANQQMRSYHYARGAYFAKHLIPRGSRIQRLKHWYWRFDLRSFPLEAFGALHYWAFKALQGMGLIPETADAWYGLHAPDNEQQIAQNPS